ncbi:MAG: glycine C-acetyltransferase [Pseudomonadota bacterium]
MSSPLIDAAAAVLTEINDQGLTKRERQIVSPQSSEISLAGEASEPILNLCANNYLGLADDPRLIAAAKAALDSHGLGMASVRFICGTSDLHADLERDLAAFKATEDSILYSSCFDANAGLFETLLGPEDAVISDALNHASIIDGIRLCKAKRLRYSNNDMADLEAKLQEAEGARIKLIATDGVFSMDGIIANLPGICDLAERYGASVMVDDSHAVGFMGSRGAGSVDHCGCDGRVALITGTFGKALGGASGGYTAGPAPVVELLRQRSRPYLFSNALAPAICGATIEAIKMAGEGGALRERLAENSAYFRDRMTGLGFTVAGADHPIIPVMLGEAVLAAQMAERMGQLGVYVTAFSFPVVPRGAARIRTQMSAAHTRAQLDRAIDAFATTGRELGVIA